MLQLSWGTVGVGNEGRSFGKNHCGMEMLCGLLVMVDALQVRVLTENGRHFAVMMAEACSENRRL